MPSQGWDSGSITSWNWPFGVTTVTAECVGGSGNGGTATGNPSTGGGGKGGAYARAVITKGAESSLDLAAGAVAGGEATVTQGGTIRCRASGGNNGANGASNSSNGAGATTHVTTNIGTTTFNGGNGGTGSFTPTSGRSGAGGGSAGPTGAGGNASAGTAGIAGTGTWGDGGTYHGAGAAGVADNLNGATTGNWGQGGGSGGKANSSTDRAAGGGSKARGLLTWTTPPVLVLDQAAFRCYTNNATNETNATPLAAQNTNVTTNLSAGDVTVLLRIRLQETSGVGTEQISYLFYVSKNSTAYTEAHPTAYINVVVPTNMTENGATSNQLGTGSGTFYAGKITSSSGYVASYGFTGQGGHTELLYGVTFIAAQLAHGDTLDFRIYKNITALDAYAVTPRITILKPEAKQKQVFSTQNAINRASFY